MARRPTRPARKPLPENSLEASLPLGAPLEDLASPVWLLDRKGAVIGANRAARALEREAGEALPLRTPGDRHILAESTELRRALEEGRSLEVCIRAPRSRGRMRVLLEPLCDASGAASGALLLASDPARSGRSRSLLGRILGTAAQELSAPLAPLATFASLARRAADDGDAGRAAVYLDRLQRHTQRIEHLAAEMRELVEVLGDELRLRNEPFDLAQMVRQAVDQAVADAPDHLFAIDGPPEVVMIGDGERIARVLAALLSNAVRFSPVGGRIEVDLKLTPRHVTLTVSDRGDGFPDERLADLLDGPCWDREAPRHGLGLGLYLAREVTERHGGVLRAERHPAGGARVRLELPRVCRT